MRNRHPTVSQAEETTGSPTEGVASRWLFVATGLAAACASFLPLIDYLG